MGEEDEEYDENIHLAYLGDIVSTGKNITGKATGLEKAAVVLEYVNKKGEYEGMCSGAMVGPNLVLTAAHCLISSQYHPARVVAAGMKKTKQGYPSAKVKNFFIPSEYSKPFKEIAEYYDEDEALFAENEYGYDQYDYGLIVLKEDLSKQTGYFGLHLPPSSINVPIYAIGWSGDLPKRTLWKFPGFLTIFDDDFFEMSAYGKGGASGSPVVLQNRPSEIIGIHIQAGVVLENNGSALKITPKIIQKVLEFRKKLAPQQPAKKKQKNRSI